MKMNPAGSVDINDHAKYSRNCNLGYCGRVYLAPVPSLSDVQLFVNFGNIKPESFDFTIFDLCKPGKSYTANSTCFVMGWNGKYWYGVFKNFTTSAAVDSFVLALNTGYQTFFSEQYQSGAGCGTLTKLSVCYPKNYNAEDPNGIYVGAPVTGQPYMGNPEIFYHHTFYTRQGEIIETGNKLTLTQNFKRNFSSKLNKVFEFRPELMPGWYKDYLVSVYFRGNILINDVQKLVTDIALEDVDVDFWKPYAVLGEEKKGAFGCAPFECAPDCIPVVCVPVSFIPVYNFPEAIAGQMYNFTIPLTGTGPFVLSDIVKPAWMVVGISGNNVKFSGMPLSGDIGSTSSVGFIISNDCGIDGLGDASISVIEAPCIPVTFGTISTGDGRNGIEYGGFINLNGDAPFSLTGTIVKPAWMTIVISGSQVLLTGIAEEGTGITISFTVENACGSVPYSETINIDEGCEDFYNNTGSTLTGISWVGCDGTVYENQDIIGGQSLCAKVGTVAGGDSGFLTSIGPC